MGDEASSAWQQVQRFELAGARALVQNCTRTWSVKSRIARNEYPKWSHVSDPLLASYEAVPYDSKPIAAAHVGVLETVARLYGMRTPPADRCRVLELGCASGGNLLPMAYQFPQSHFVGIDLAPSQIAEGREAIAALGLENVVLESMSISDIDDDFGMFDYIICHGVYSWVPPEVQGAILRVCARHLAPNGVAYVSYNTYPGWHNREMVRDMILFHDDPRLPPSERIARGRAFVKALVVSQADTRSVHATLLGEEAHVLESQNDAHFLHEQLEPFNSPVYFAEFARRAEACGLAYLAEAKLSTNGRGVPTELVRAGVVDASDVIRSQQYADFARGRAFRRTLLRHKEMEAAASPAPETLFDLHLTMRAVAVEPATDDAARGAGVESFRSSEDVTVTTNNPLVIAALRALLRVAPATLSFRDLLCRVNDRLDADATPGIAQEVPDRSGVLAGALLQCALAGLVDVHTRASNFATLVSERPTASPLARYRAMRSGLVPNLRHAVVDLSDLERLILIHLDGTRARPELLAMIDERIADGAIDEVDASSGADRLEAINAALARFAASALLEA